MTDYRNDDDPTLELLFAVAEERKERLLEDGSDKLAKIGQVGAAMRALDDEIKLLEASVESKKKELFELRTKTLPDLLREVGMSSFALDDGTTVELKDEIYPDIPAALREEAYEWLRQHGHGDLIKHEIKVTFGMGEDTDALRIRQLLVEHESPLNFSEKETVLPQSLKAWIKEQDRKGGALPEGLINVHRVTVAQMKTPKGTRK